MKRKLFSLFVLAIVARAPSLRAGVVESYEAGVDNVTLEAGADSPSVAASSVWATHGVNSAKFTLNGDWAWKWNYHNVLPSVADVAANKYLLFDFNVVSGQFKLGGMAANSNGGWKQQDSWNDALAQPGGAGQLLPLPTYSSGENRGFGVFIAGATGTFAWDYKTAGFAPAVGDTYASFQINLQGPSGSVIHLDNLRVANAIPEPAALALIGSALGSLLFARRRNA
jgi:hypothetical protein